MSSEQRLSFALDAACGKSTIVGKACTRARPFCMGAGLQYLHSQNPPVVHRNVKPGSLYVDASGTCKVGSKNIPCAGLCRLHRMSNQTSSQPAA